MLEIIEFILGPAQTNAYLVADTDTHEAAVIDPAWDGHVILEAAQEHGWNIRHLWYTHAHFDHIGGAAAIANALDPQPVIALHPDDHALWRAGGGAAFFGFEIDPGPPPALDLYHGQILRLGGVEFEVRFTPGHTPGHCIFYVVGGEELPAGRSRSAGRTQNVCFTGDLIFAGAVGRTDFPGGDWDALINSIRTQVFTLPDDTRLLSGHGPGTTVGDEKANNPFIGEE